MIQINSDNLIKILTQPKPVLIFFHHRADAAQSYKIINTLKYLQKELPLLTFFDYIIDLNAENQVLADYLNVNHSPNLIFSNQDYVQREINCNKETIIKLIDKYKLHKNYM